VEDFVTQERENVGFAYLKLGPGARGIALSNASLEGNPAGIIRSETIEVSFTHIFLFQDIRYESIGFSTKRGNNGYGLGALGLFVDGIELRKENQDSIGEYKAYNSAFLISYARDLGESLNIGATFKGLYERIYVNSLSGWALDFGLLYNPKKNILLSLVFDNVGPAQKFSIPNPEKIGLPFTVKFGSSLSLWNSLFLFELNKPCDQVLQINSGIEYALLSNLLLRVSYKLMYDKDFKLKKHNTQGFSWGFGLNEERFSLDYAYNPYKLDIGSSHIFSLSFKF
jgi:hypothetical protein